MEAKVILGLGSNLGDRERTIREAIQLINSRCGEVISSASLYESEPIGFDSENNFLNTCIAINSALSPESLLSELKVIETELGRTYKSTSGIYTSRTIDLDIIFFNSLIINTDNLTIPHPRYRERKFVLLPLIDLEKDYVDPETGLSMEVVLEKCLDESMVSVYKKDFSWNE